VEGEVKVEGEDFGLAGSLPATAGDGEADEEGERGGFAAENRRSDAGGEGREDCDGRPGGAAVVRNGEHVGVTAVPLTPDTDTGAGTEVGVRAKTGAGAELASTSERMVGAGSARAPGVGC
ncbi:unnamed protein product, partial [Discosporangium mesarthrocarpum]